MSATAFQRMRREAAKKEETKELDKKAPVSEKESKKQKVKAE